MNCLRELPQEYLDLCPIIDEKYRVVFRLGLGRFSKVKMAINLATNERVAIKIMNEKIKQDQVERGYQEHILSAFVNEVKMCFQARHRNTVQIIDFNVGGQYRSHDGHVQHILYYVMRIQQYGQLHRVITQTEQFSEKTARHIFKQLLSALRHTHSLRIAHCDIKSQNVLIDQKFNIKLVDFGYARYFQNKHGLPICYSSADGVGTYKANAPQLMNQIDRMYHPDSVDVFAAGCFLFQLVMKTQPFKSTNPQDQFYCKLTNNSQQFWGIFASKCNPTNDFKDLIQRMLRANPNQRISFQGVMKHAWTNGQCPKKQDYKKQMNLRLKKVMVKVRKEQQSQMKQTFMKEKGKRQAHSLHFGIAMDPVMEQEIIALKQLMHAKNKVSSQSDCSSLEEGEAGGKSKENAKSKKEKWERKSGSEGSGEEERVRE